MRRPQHIKALMDYFTGPFLSKARDLDPAVISHLRHCRCDVDIGDEDISMRFRLASLFDAIWRSAVDDGIALPNHSDWANDFRAFCNQLMFPWPEKRLRHFGFQCTLVNKSTQNATAVYELSNRPSL